MSLESLQSTFETLSPSQRYVSTVFVIILLWIVKYAFQAWRMQVKVPSVGNHWIGAIFSIPKNRTQLLEAYQKYPEGLFKVPMFPFGTIVVANGPKLIAEIRNGPNDVFDFEYAGQVSVQAHYTFEKDFSKEQYQIQVVTNGLTRNLAAVFPELLDEMEATFSDVLDLSETGEWKSFPMYDTANKIIARTSGRVFVGKTLCRNEKYQQIAINNMTHATIRAALISLFPTWSHPIVGRILGGRRRYPNMLMPLLGPMIEERRAKMQTYGKDWADKPNDFLTWVMEAAPPDQSTTRNFVIEILGVNFVALQTTGMALTHALYYLATYPECQEILYDEANSVITEHGWSKPSMQKLYKLDSFLRESARLNPIALISLLRYMRKDWTFSDGTLVKAGNWVCASSYSIHMDEAKYPNAEQFDPWRFSDIRATESEATRHQYITTTPDFLAFGSGKHACPGRFFASNELKAMLCYIVIHYDIKLTDEATGRPPNSFVGVGIVPNEKAHLQFRRKLTTSATQS